MKTKVIFCAGCQAETEQTLAIVKAEIVAACPCGRALKFNAGISREEFDAQLERHRQANLGQLPPVDEDPVAVKNYLSELTG